LCLNYNGTQESNGKPHLVSISDVVLLILERGKTEPYLTTRYTLSTSKNLVKLLGATASTPTVNTKVNTKYNALLTEQNTSNKGTNRTSPEASPIALSARYLTKNPKVKGKLNMLRTKGSPKKLLP
jgi:hypothetical protein